MAELKTKPREGGVAAFLESVENEQKRQDSFAIFEMMRAATGEEPKMWGDSIIGFGSYHYRYASGREGNWMLIGFSPRKQSLTLYFTAGFEQDDALLSRLGKYTTGSSCLYIKKLTDVNQDVLRELIARSVERVRAINASANQ